MSRRSILFLCCAATCFVATACQKLDDVRPLASPKRGALPMEQAKFLDAVPAEYGDLVAVTSNAEYPTWSQAWFERPDKSIVIVTINSGTGRILDRIIVVPRR